MRTLKKCIIRTISLEKTIFSLNLLKFVCRIVFCTPYWGSREQNPLPLFVQSNLENQEVTMSAISLASFNSFRPSGATLQSAQPQRGGNIYGSANGTAAARGSSAAYNSGTGSAYCPTCNGNVSRSASPSSSSYCPTCNRSGGAQSNIAGANQSYQSGQGGRACIACNYQGR
jgi:hypothetical protein